MRARMSDVVTLQLPRDRDFNGVAHLVLGGLAARLELTYDVLDDMTTAIDELLERRDSLVTLSVEIEDDALVATIGPFSARVADELNSSGETFGLKRVLDATDDEVRVSERGDAQWVELRKSLGKAAADVG